MELNSFLGNRQSLSYSRIFQHFMEPEGSLSCSQEPDQSRPYHPPPSLFLYEPGLLVTLFSHLRLGLSSRLFPPGLPTKTLSDLFSPMRPTYPTHLILLDMVILIILGEEFILCSSSLCSFLQPPTA
jgi:hypothetical protein